MKLRHFPSKRKRASRPLLARRSTTRTKPVRGASDAHPVQYLLVFDTLQPFERRFHLVAFKMPRQQHELFLEFRLIERTLRGSLETRHPPRHFAPVLEPDRHGNCRILAALARRLGDLDPRREIENGAIVNHRVVE